MALTTPHGAIKQFDLYWVDLEPARGHEIQKVRPAIVVSPDILNQTVSTILVVPLTSTIINWPWRLTLRLKGKSSSAACDHIRSVDKSRLRKKLGRLTADEQKRILTILQQLFAT